MKDWKTLSSKEIYETQTPWIHVRRDEVENHLGKPLTYSVVSLHHPTVFIVAVNNKKEIYLQKNYRYTIDQTIWELSAGHSDGQDALTAAKRELLEETGLESDDWTNLGEYYQAIGVANFPLTVCLAKNVRAATFQPQEDVEQIVDRRFFSMDHVRQMIKNGDIIDATDIGALYIVKLHMS
jgi:8-oxo-dGDP phosphatase